jgi:hypothetical protein
LSFIRRALRHAESRAAIVRCDESGLHVVGVPLLERATDLKASNAWRPRPICDLNADLSKRYNVQIELIGTLQRLQKIAEALNAGDIGAAQVLSLHLRFPPPLSFAAFAGSSADGSELVKQLLSAGLLKIDWDESEHPRWPAGTTGGLGGRFAPAGGEQSSGANGARGGTHCEPSPRTVR